MKLLPLNHSANTHRHPEIAIVESFFISVADMHFNVIAVAWLTIAALCPYRLWSHIGAGSTTTWTSFQVPQGYHSPKQLGFSFLYTKWNQSNPKPHSPIFTIFHSYFSLHIAGTLFFPYRKNIIFSTRSTTIYLSSDTRPSIWRPLPAAKDQY